jgi:hypothetical protein
MKKFVMLIVMCLMLSGCSLIPKINFDTPNTVPQAVDRSTVKDTCKGEAKFNELGEMIYCSKGYSAYAKNYEKKERKMTVVERIKSFVNNLTGYAFWIALGLLIFCPSALGFIGGRIIEGIFGVGKKTLNSVVKAVQTTRKTGKDLNDTLSAELDDKEKDYIVKLKREEKIK